MKKIFCFLLIIQTAASYCQVSSTTIDSLLQIANDPVLAYAQSFSTTVPTAADSIVVKLTNSGRKGLISQSQLKANLTTTGSLGYATGAGGTVSQSGTKANGVTINKATGTITMVNSALAAAAEAKFTVTNSTVTATDIPVVVIKSGGTSGSYMVSVTAVAAGSFDITISNVSTGSLSEAVVLSFAIIKGVAN